MKKLVTIALVMIAGSIAHAQSSPYYTQDGVAIKGYDPVAYFADHAAVAGAKPFSYVWQNATWTFKNDTNMNLFKANPEKYAPQFGGYCAYGASQNHKSPTDPNAFTIVNDKLYLNYNPRVKEMWVKDTTGNIAKAESNWVTLKDAK